MLLINTNVMSKVKFFIAILFFCHVTVFADTEYDTWLQTKARVDKYYQWLQVVHQDQGHWFKQYKTYSDSYYAYDSQDQGNIQRLIRAGFSNCTTEKLNGAGSCNGWSLVWLYFKWLQFSHPETGAPFKQALNDIPSDEAKVFGELLQSSSAAMINDVVNLKKCASIKKIISLVNNFQGLAREEEITGKMNQLLSQYNEQMRSEYAITAPLDLAELEQLLQAIVIYDHRLILIYFNVDDQGNHAVALFKDGKNYYYYDPNDPLGEIHSTQLTVIAQSILNSHDIFTKTRPVFSFRIFSGAKEPAIYPDVQKILQKIAASLRNNAEQAAVLLAALYYNHHESLRYFLNKNREIDLNLFIKTSGYNSYTLLITSIMGNYNEMAKLLIANNAALDLVNYGDSGDTVTDYSALQWAVMFDNVELVSLLLANGANPNLISNDHGRNALMINAMNPEAGPLSKKWSSYIRSATVNQYVPKAFHARKHTLEIAKLLLDYHANINLVDEHNCSALMYAVEQNSVEMVRLLLAYNADINLVDQHQRTALAIARARGYTDIAELLQKHTKSVDFYNSSKF